MACQPGVPIHFFKLNNSMRCIFRSLRSQQWALLLLIRRCHVADVRILAAPFPSEFDGASLFDFVVELGLVLVLQLQGDLLGAQLRLRVEECVVFDDDGEIVVVLIFNNLRHNILLVVSNHFRRYIMLQSRPNKTLGF